ncbi:MAG: DUF2029 domain-containing protein [Bacteroidetes bacterium]|nr:DUF2029 domain-containing protein [Bacteroidota bacterium]
MSTSFLLRRNTLLAVYVLVALAASIHLLILKYDFYIAGYTHTSYNNYIIFKRSFIHLLHNQNLYVQYLDEQWDLFKYSPTFAFLMAPFAYLPDIIGLCLWNLLNAMVLFYAIRLLPFNNRSIALLLWFVLAELLTSIQGAQSNALIAGLVVAAFCMMERGKHSLAALWLVCAAFIKIYGGIGFCLFMFYPGKLKAAAYSVFWTLTFLLLPLIIVSPHSLLQQYINWKTMLAADAANYGWSVMGVLQKWFGLGALKPYIMATGLLLFFIPLARVSMYQSLRFRLLFLAAMLVWVVIFNHRAESPTYIIAVTGIAIWFFTQRRAWWRTALLWFVLVVTCFSHSDITPAAIRTTYVYPYYIKAIPAIIAWVCIYLELVLLEKHYNINIENRHVRKA